MNTLWLQYVRLFDQVEIWRHVREGGKVREEYVGTFTVAMATKKRITVWGETGSRIPFTAGEGKEKNINGIRYIMPLGTAAQVKKNNSRSESMSFFRRKSPPGGAFGSSAGKSDPIPPEWQRGKGKPTGGKVQTLTRVYACQVCSARQGKENKFSNDPKKLGLFALQVDWNEQAEGDVDVLFAQRLLALNRNHGGLDLCLHCEAVGVTMGTLTPDIAAAMQEYRSKHPPSAQMIDLWKVQTRR